MSCSYRITPKAVEDLKRIGRYTQRKWGQDQRNRYLRGFEARFNWLAESPDRGKQRPDVKAGYYCYPQGRHLIFYLIGDAGIEIIGIPHQRMDMDRYNFQDQFL